MITACVQDPDIYDPANVATECEQVLRLLFLRKAEKHHVTLVDSKGLIEGVLKIIARRLPADESVLLQHCLKRVVAVPVADKLFSGLESNSGYLEGAEQEDKTIKARLAALALVANDEVDAVVVSQRDRESLEVMLAEDVQLLNKAVGIGSFLRNTHEVPVVDSLLQKAREEVFDTYFAPIMRWSKSLIIIDKQMGQAFGKGNWKDFSLTINWLRRCWRESCRVPGRVAMQVITMPPRNEAGHVLAPNMGFAEDIWRSLGSWDDIQIHIVRPRRDEFYAEGMDDVSHDRYLISMPHEFVVNVSRGFDLLTEGGGENFRKAASVGLLPCQPPDVEAMLRVKGTGCAYPSGDCRPGKRCSTI